MRWPFRTATDRLVDALLADPPAAPEPAPAPTHSMPVAATFDAFSGSYVQTHDGEKFLGGMPETIDLITDYWALRQRSADLFERNIYARRAVRALTHAVVNTGLFPEATPLESVIGVAEDSLDDWADDVEARWGLYANTPELCDYHQKLTDGELQAVAFAEALLVGDVLRVTRYDDRGTPSTQLINGAAVCNPTLSAVGDRDIRHGVELDAQKREVAYWVLQEDLTHERIPARNGRGELVASLVRVSDARLDGVRGMPILAVVLQMLSDLDSYRHSALRKAVVASAVALFVTTSEDGVGSRPLAGSATRRDVVESTGGQVGRPVNLNVRSMVPGITIDRLARGEDIKFGPSTGTDEKFGDFEAAIVAAMASCLNIPPEIFRQTFSSNYSASQAANHEFQSYVQIVRRDFGARYCRPGWRLWLINEVLERRIEALGFLEAWRARGAAAVYMVAAWVSAEWAGHVKPTTDIFKQMRGLEIAVNLGAIDYDTLSRNFNGSRFRTNVKRQKKQRRLATEAGIPLAASGAGAGSALDTQGQDEENPTDDTADDD